MLRASDQAARERDDEAGRAAAFAGDGAAAITVLAGAPRPTLHHDTVDETVGHAMGTRRGWDVRWFSFGSPAAVVTSMGLIVGLDAATTTRAAVAGSLLIIGFADNLTDSLSVHMYQESERLAEQRAFRTTVANYVSRAIVSLSFVALFLLLPAAITVPVCAIWGFFLLSGLSYVLARERKVRAIPEILKHAGVALGVIVISRGIGLLIQNLVGVA